MISGDNTDQNQNDQPKVNVEEEMSAIKSTIIDNWKKLTVSYIRLRYAFGCDLSN